MRTPLNLQSGDIHLWMTHPKNIQDPALLAEYKQLLTDEELTRQQRYRFEKDQHSALITRAFVRTVLSQYANIAPADWRFSKGEKDKPEIINPPKPIRFNLSHTDGLIICAVCLEHDVGCDVENIERDNDILNIADRYFSPQEVKELFSLPAEQQRSRFFDYWTLKESYIKACGQGLAIPLDDFTFHINESKNTSINNDIQLSFAPHRIDHPELWHSWLIYPNNNYRIAISIKSSKTIQHTLHFYTNTPLLDSRQITFNQ